MAHTQKPDNDHGSHKHKQHMASAKHWVNGWLREVQEFFETLEEALEWAIAEEASTYKVYNRDGDICHSGGHIPHTPSYA